MAEVIVQNVAYRATVYRTGEEVLDEINHVNVGDIKKEPTDQDTSEDPFDICDTNIKQEDENFMSSSPSKHVTSDEELSLNHENKPKKLNIEQSEVRIVVFDSSQHVTPREKGLIVRIIVLLILA